MTRSGTALAAAPPADYAEIPGTNWSRLKAMRTSPLHYRHALTEPREDTDSLRLGRAVHTAVFEPDEMPIRFAVWQGGRRAGKEWDAFCTANAHATILTVDQYERACAIRDAVRSHPVAAPYLAAGVAEKAITWTDARTGRPCKARLDWVSSSSPAIVDLKSSRTIEERQFAGCVARYAYHCQLAWYRAGWQAVTGDELPCVLVAVESEAPHDVAVYRLDDDALYAGAEEVVELMDRLIECERTGVWPGRYPQEVELRLPAWAWPDESDAQSFDLEGGGF